MEIYFTKHANEKFKVLSRHGVKISRNRIIETIENLNMKKNNVKIKYDPESDILSWEVSKTAKIDYASEVGNIVVHFTKNHIPVLIEVLGASKLISKSEKTVERARELAFSSR